MDSTLSSSGKKKVNVPKKISEFLKKQKELDNLYSDKKLGSFVKNDKTYFRLFAPSADKISLLTFEQPEQTNGKEFKMVKDENGVWEWRAYW